MSSWFLVQDLIAGGYNVQSQAGLVLAGAGLGHPPAASASTRSSGTPEARTRATLFRYSRVWGGLRPVSGADDGVQARLPAVGEHVIQIIIDPFVHLESIG